MSRLRIFTNPIDGHDKVLHVRTDRILEAFKYIKKKHPHARIYLQPACAHNDVTPTNKIDEASLLMLSKKHDFDVVCEAGEPATIIAAVSLVVSLAFSIYTILTMPDANKGIEKTSSNNKLGNRENTQRIGGRIPDPYGTVLAIPDLIAPPLRYFQNNVEIEECLMCLGRGYYEISDVKEGETSINQIDGESVSVYDPNQSLDTTNPMYRYGDVLNYAPLVGKQSRSITGQTLLNPSSARVVENTITFTYPNVINVATTAFVNGETISIEGAQYGVKDQLLSGTVDIGLDYVLTVATSTDIYQPQKYKGLTIQALLIDDPVEGTLDLAGVYEVSNIVKTGSAGSWVYEISLVNPQTVNQNFLKMTEAASSSISGTLTDNIDSMDLDGTYTININSGTSITLSAPDAINPDWLKLQNWGSTAGNMVGLYGSQENWLGWYETDTEGDQIFANFNAPQGLYHIGEKGYKEVIGVQLEMEYQLLDSTGMPTGSIYSISENLFGNPQSIASPVGLTLKATLPSTSRLRYRLRRLTVHSSKGTVVDEVQAHSVYIMTALTKLSYDDVTLVRTVTVTNDITSGVKKRELNMLATRKVFSYESGSKSPERIASKKFADIVCAVTRDDYIGRRSIDTVDIQDLYATQSQIQSYFGTSNAIEFNYTFDSDNMSYEETLATIASAVFCNARRTSGKIYFQFEKVNPSSSILFNHRNKMPQSETVTTRFGKDKQYDGVEATWRNASENYTEESIKLPNDGITNPKKIDLIGVTNKVQAHFLAHRAWNRIKYQRETIQFTAYGEADLITINDRIAVVKDSIPTLVPLGVDGGFTSGEIEAWTGQNIQISQPVHLDATKAYTIHLQLSNGSVETMLVTQGVDEWHLVLERLPILPLITSSDGKVTATNYSITLSNELDSEAYLISEKSPSATFESEITAVNYDERYYSNDSDYINNLIP
ncbi:host specificity factor TipJ family phage tail protein [Acinetobacter geminorum]|uniref:host specificity factor TipJ family phage tail protein n=1 Tax=Acinetobacter geminorum TaxID=2730922 RepID=UPI00147856A2|nr:host specificity factor TipJ family phage tail protein [Acinetobacter geminorum]